MKMSDEALKIIEESQNREKLKQVIDLIEERLVEHAIVPTELQWTILINHLNEMLKRSQRKETIPVVDRDLFKEVSPIMYGLFFVFVGFMWILNVK